MGLELTYINGQNPLDEEEREGLLIPSISTREELDEFEQQNIENAMLWLLGKSFKAEVIFKQDFICKLHKMMFGDVWAWAGKFRKTNKNIGVDRWDVPLSLRTTCDDALFWVQHEVYPPDELALRFKHRLVSIHCFPNGNGRHSRLMADVISEKVFDKPAFTWGASNLAETGTSRSVYIKALKDADQGDINLLLSFSRS